MDKFYVVVNTNGIHPKNNMSPPHTSWGDGGGGGGDIMMSTTNLFSVLKVRTSFYFNIIPNGTVTSNLLQRNSMCIVQEIKTETSDEIPEHTVIILNMELLTIIIVKVKQACLTLSMTCYYCIYGHAG